MSDKTEQKISLNDEQIAARDYPYTKPAVVTAAAGSGKTMLLVERVIKLLLAKFSDNRHDCSSDEMPDIKADSMAIMTFTRNATKNLREKLNKRLRQELENCSNDEKRKYISEQIILLRQAYISTIDSFCLRLIRENPEAFDLPLNFTMATLTKKITMQLRAMELAMREFYNEDPQSCNFTDDERRGLFYTFNFENDKALQENLMSVEDTLSTYKDADKWLTEAANAYKSEENYEKSYIEAVKTQFANYLAKVEAALSEYNKILERNLEEEAKPLFRVTVSKTCKKEETINRNVEKKMEGFRANCLVPMKSYIEKDKERFEVLSKQFNVFSSDPSLATLTQMLKEFAKCDKIKAPKLTGKPTNLDITQFNEPSKALKEIAEEIVGSYSETDQTAAFYNQQAAVNTFIKLLRIYHNHYTYIRKTSGNLDFSDCQLMLLKKLSNDEEFREQIASRFKCVIIDEFQDSNDVQAEIFKLIGGGHLFYVGDIKQSIYSFRGGNPQIMADLCKGTDGFTPLPLNRNYRSRKEVLATANYAFSGLMTEKYGGVNYVDPLNDPLKDNRLVYAANMPSSDNPEKYLSEICLVNPPPKNDKDSENSMDIEKEMVQPRAVARRIKELLDDENFFITKENSLHEKVLVRPKFSDFTILMRSVKRAPLFRMALAEVGIPTSAPKGRNFLETEEVNLILDYLTVVDNPQRDEEVLKVLMSPIYRLTAKNMSLIRLGLLGIDINTLDDSDKQSIINSVRGHSLYGCVRICCKESDEQTGIKRTIDVKLQNFYNDINTFRYFMCTNSIYKLVCKICEDTDLLSTVAAFSDSALRIANVRQFQDMAADFETRDGSSLSDFLNYIKYAKSLEDNKIEEAQPPEDTDSVKIMTFHKSKGLEFPVCIMCELEKTMSTEDISGTLLINRNKYFALKSVDSKKRVKSENPAYTALKAMNRVDMCGEELRLLYVAMTRAQDKLIMFATASSEKWTAELFDPQNPDTTFEHNVPFKWIFNSLMRYYNNKVPGKFDPEVCCNLIETEATGKPESVQTEKTYSDISDDEVNRLAEKIAFTYKYESDTIRRAKYSVTELAHINSENRIYFGEPDFVKNGELTGAEVGTAYHTCMQFIPIDKLKAADKSDYLDIVKNAIQNTNELNPDEKRVVNPVKIVGFLNSELGQRMLKSTQIRREKRFFDKIDGAKIGYDSLGGFTLQGVVDMYFIENNEIVVVDYKTDTVANFEKERENYEKQVMIYSTILPMQTGLSVKEVYLYTFTNSEAYQIK